MTTLNFSLVNGEDGNVDRDASLANAVEALDTHMANRELEDTQLGSAVNAVFDELKASGSRANLEYIIAQAMIKLNVSAMPSAYGTLKEKVGSYIRANSQGKTNKETGAVQRPDSLFVIGRGAGSSTQRRADLATPAAS